MSSDTAWIPWDKEWFWRWLMNWINAKNSDWRPDSTRGTRYRQLDHPEYRNVVQGPSPYTFDIKKKMVAGRGAKKPTSEAELLISITMTEYERRSKLVIDYVDGIGLLREEFWLALEPHMLPTYMIPAEVEPTAVEPSMVTDHVPLRLTSAEQTEITMDSIPEHYHRVAHLLAQGLSYDEIAAETGHKIGAVYTYKRDISSILNIKPAKQNMVAKALRDLGFGQTK
jgi:hypothetical protein